MTEFDDRLAAIKARAEAATYLGGEAQEVADDALWLHEQVERLSAAVEAARAVAERIDRRAGRGGGGEKWAYRASASLIRRALDAHLTETKEGDRG